MKRLLGILAVLCAVFCFRQVFFNAASPELWDGNIEPLGKAFIAGAVIYVGARWLGKMLDEREIQHGNKPSTQEAGVPAESVASAPQQEDAEPGQQATDDGPSGY